MSLWKPYQSSSSLPWNERRVIHLHRRTVFGVCWPEIQRDLADDPQSAITRILNGTNRAEGVPESFDDLTETIGESAVVSGSPDRLKAWWIYRCLFSPRPLEERLTLMWHNHFATSNLKVNNLRLMKQQNELLRRHAMSRFGDLLSAMFRDPAMLVWLDASSNRAGSPNENLARELMELFTLGIGHYTEQDVAEAARALTGWTVRQDVFRILDEYHDAGQKTILGQTGPWTEQDLVRILLEQEPCARRIAGRLTSEFFGEKAVSEQALSELTDGLRANQIDIRWGIETILRSELFFSESNLGSRIAEPVTFLIAPLRALECWRNPPSTLMLAEWCSRAGQNLFYPPNVGGWAGGRTWLSARTMIARANYAAALSLGQLTVPASRPQLPPSLVDDDDLIRQIHRIGQMICGDISLETVQQIVELSQKTVSQQELPGHCVNQLMTRPEVHLN